MARKKCKHGISNNGFYCKQCKIEGIGGKGICEHDLQRSQCKECKKTGNGGKGICEHDLQRSQCKECKKLGKGGQKICEHDLQRSTCKECKKTGNGGKGICEHDLVRSTCKECKKTGNGGKGICEHDLVRSTCKKCKKTGNGGKGICEHDLVRSQCSKCREALPIGECLTRYKYSCVICGKQLQTLKRKLEKTCYEHSQEYKKRPEHYWQEHVMKQIQFKPSYIDQPLKSCDKLDVFRPDLCYLTKDIAFALEFDEESHSAYEVNCELKKTNNMKDLFPNRKLVMIRMNPHPNKDVPKKYKEMAQRTDFMLDLFQSVLENPEKYDLSDKATNVFYLFYGKNGLKHIQAAEKCEGVIIQDKFLCSK